MEDGAYYPAVKTACKTSSGTYLFSILDFTERRSIRASVNSFKLPSFFP